MAEDRPDNLNPPPPPFGDPPPVDPPATPPPVTYVVKVDGVERRVTPEELVKNYQLEQTSRQRLAELAEQKKEIAGDLELAGTLRQLLAHPGDPRFVNRIGQLLEIPQDVVDTVTAQVPYQQPGQPGQPPPPNQPPPDPSAPPRPPSRVGFADLDPQIIALLQQVEQTSVKQNEADLDNLRQKMFALAKNTVDTDPELGTIEDEERKAKAVRFVQNEVQRRVGLNHEPWPDCLGDIIAEARSVFNEPEGTEETEADQAARVAIGPITHMAPGPIPTEPVKRPSVDDPQHVTKFNQRLFQLLKGMNAKTS